MSKANNRIIDLQNEKQNLYDKISEIDNNLVEINEIISKFENKKNLLVVSPKEVFTYFEKLGYTNKYDILDDYLELIRTIELERDNELVSDKNYFDF